MDAGQVAKDLMSGYIDLNVYREIENKNLKTIHVLAMLYLNTMS